MKDKHWAPENELKPGPDLCPEIKKNEIDPEVLQATVRLADKLDCGDIIKEIIDNIDQWNLVYTDPLGWLILGRKLRLHQITAAALDDLARTFSARPVYVDNTRILKLSDNIFQKRLKDCHAVMKDDRWLEVDPSTFMLVMEAKTVFALKGLWTNRDNLALIDEILEKYAAPGDLVTAEFPDDPTEEEMEEGQP